MKQTTATFVRRRRGVVLIVVLVVIVMLTLAGFAFTELMFTERKAAVFSARRAQARALADSGAEAARLFLDQPEQERTDSGGWYDNPDRFCGVTVIGDDRPDGPGRFTIIAPEGDDGPAGSYRFGLQNESARLNVNALLSVEKIKKNSGRQMLMGLPEMTEEIADAILDWIDNDRQPRESGAESDYYSSLQPPYEPRNGPLESIEELLLVRGVTPSLLFGGDVDRNGIDDADESGGQDTPSAERGWIDYLTLHSRETNRQPDGKPRINLNQDDMKKLHGELKDALADEAGATFIVAYRQNGAYAGDDAGKTEVEGKLDLSKPGKTALKSVLDLIGVRAEVQLEGKEEKTVLKSPLANNPKQLSDLLPRLMDCATVDASPTTAGRININQAPRVVLAAIPAMQDRIVEAILSARQEDPTEAESDRRHPTWILSQRLVTLKKMKKLMPYVTGGGDVFRAEVIGYFDRGGPAARIEVVLDATDRPTRIASWKDLSRLGRGYSLDTLGAETSQ